MCSLRSCYLREKSFMGMDETGLFNVIWLKSIHTFIVTVFTASASIRVSARNASLYIAVMIFCAQPYLKPCFMCPFYILSTCPSKGLCTALLPTHIYVQTTTDDPFKWNPLWQWNLFRLHAKIFCLFVSLCFLKKFLMFTKAAFTKINK